MADSHIQQCIEWLNWYSQQYGAPQNDPATVVRLMRAIADYLQWMTSANYSLGTQHMHRRQLELFLDYVKNRRLPWQQLFTVNTREHFKKFSGLATTTAINGLSRYLVKQGQIKTPLPQHPQQRNLTGIFEDYLQFRKDGHQANTHQLVAIRRVLSALCDYLNEQDITLQRLRIEDLDAFMATFNVSRNTRRIYRYHLRGFLRYLYHERKVIKRDLAPLLVGPPQFAQTKLPKFLRPKQVKKLFDSLTFSNFTQMRTYAMVHLAYSLGLRPVEISRVTLDDISFQQAELTIRERKGGNPVTLPVPEKVIKAIALYVSKGRPKSPSRHLFLTHQFPYHPVSSGTVIGHISKVMKQAGLPSSAYWLRHTYAQNLLHMGRSIYEVKEMMGHQNIQSTHRYLHINTELMRKVLFDEEL